MTRGVFLHREDSRYDDRPAEQYQFPRQYLGRASQFIGDWIIYYEPRRGPTGRGYYAIARVERIIPDPTTTDMYIALIEPGSYLPFEQSVPFSGINGVVEQGVLNDAGRVSGRAQAAVRPISIEDFNRIVDLGIPDETPLLPREGSSIEPPSSFREEPAPFMDAARDRVSYLQLPSSTRSRFPPCRARRLRLPLRRDWVEVHQWRRQSRSRGGSYQAS